MALHSVRWMDEWVAWKWGNERVFLYFACGWDFEASYDPSDNWHGLGMWYGADGEENEVRGGGWKEEYGGHIVPQVGGYENVVL